MNDLSSYQYNVREYLSQATLEEDADYYNIPEGGFINKDSHLLVFLSDFPEDQVKDEEDYEQFYIEDNLFDDDDANEEF